MVAKTNSIALHEATNGVYIDFEGQKKHPPALIGILCDDQFQQIVLDPRLKSAADAKSLPQDSLRDVVGRLIQECRAGNRCLIAFSTYELNVIKTYCDIDVSDHYKNALKFSKRWKWHFHRDINLDKNSLDQFMTLPTVNYEVPKHLGKGNAAKRLNTVTDMLEKRGEYSKLTAVAKAKWTKLLDYNEHDVRGMRTLVLQAARDMELGAKTRGIR
jgi:hypothetical protein